MVKYPIRYWLLVSISLALGGALAMGKDYLSGRGHLAFGATFFGLGVAFIVALIPWLRSPGR